MITNEQNSVISKLADRMVDVLQDEMVDNLAEVPGVDLDNDEMLVEIEHKLRLEIIDRLLGNK